jgi:hypothetical protein
MKKRLYRNLSGLKSHERFWTSVKALAKGDTDYYKQLVRSCPAEEAVEYLDLLKAASDCAVQVTLAIHMILAQWEMINIVVLKPLDLDSKHVEYYYTTHRKYPELSEDNCRVVEGYYSLLEKKMACEKDGDHSGSSELEARALASFMPHLFYVHSYGVENVYVSEETEFDAGLIDSVRCMIACYFLDKARGLIAESLRLVLPAFGSVCRSEMGLEPDIVLKAFSSPAAVSLIDEFSQELDELDVESNVRQEWESSLRETWQSYDG